MMQENVLLAFNQQALKIMDNRFLP